MSSAQQVSRDQWSNSPKHSARS